MIKILKSKAPKTDHWGIPLVTLDQSLYEESVFVLYFRKFSNQIMTGLSRLYASSFAIKRLWGQSYILERSIIIVITKPELSSSFFMTELI